MPKRILITASTSLHISNFHLPYINAFQKLGYQVAVACGGTREEFPIADRVIYLPLEKSIHSLHNWKAVRILQRELQLRSYEMILCHTSLASFFTRMAVHLVRDKPPVVCTVHGYLFDEHSPMPRQALLLAAEKLAAPVTTLLLTMNEWDEAFAREHCLGGEIAAIPGMGVDFSPIKKVSPKAGAALRKKIHFSEGDFVLIYAAEFSRRKNQSLLLHAMAGLPRRVKLMLPGEGALRKDCIRKAYAMGIADRVVFPGHVSNMPVWYAAADAAVSSSRSEGLPFHIMEAMGSGLPVVVSAVKGHTDLIREGVTGLLYPPGDVRACRRQIACLLVHQEQRRAMGERAREAVAKYDLACVLPQVMNCYLQALPKG